MKHLWKLLNLSPRLYLLLVKTFMMLLLVRVGLKFLSFQTLHQRLEQISHYRFTHTANLVKLNHILWAVNRTSRYMPGKVKCLARALTTYTLMVQYGYVPQLRIGVAKGESGQLEAHAWVENQGLVVIGQLPDLTRFKTLPSLGKH
ncbi:MAG: lasso peptide biosynthesis B2 protein [Moorea sp. SIO3G5]|nr:lasso peptide biosynthesis B2 protein [Moorena sp. SIO3G5]